MIKESIPGSDIFLTGMEGGIPLRSKIFKYDSNMDRNTPTIVLNIEAHVELSKCIIYMEWIC